VHLTDSTAVTTVCHGAILANIALKTVSDPHFSSDRLDTECVQPAANAAIFVIPHSNLCSSARCATACPATPGTILGTVTHSLLPFPGVDGGGLVRSEIRLSWLAVNNSYRHDDGGSDVTECEEVMSSGGSLRVM